MNSPAADWTCYHLFILKLGRQSYKAPHVMGDKEFEAVMDRIGWRLPIGIRVFHFRDIDQLLLNPVVEAYPVLNVSVLDLFYNAPEQPMKLKDRLREKTFPISRKCGDLVLCDVDHIYKRLYRVDGTRCSIITKMKITPISLKQAKVYISQHHRHCGPPKFHKFSVCLTVNGEPEPVGVAVASTPKAKAQMDGKTLEINRVCSDPRYADACSKLYALSVRIGKNLGYERFVSYTLPEESGASLKAAGFQMDGKTCASAHGWDSPSRPRSPDKYPEGEKLRWVLKTEC